MSPPWLDNFLSHDASHFDFETRYSMEWACISLFSDRIFSHHNLVTRIFTDNSLWHQLVTSPLDLSTPVKDLSTQHVVQVHGYNVVYHMCRLGLCTDDIVANMLSCKDACTADARVHITSAVNMHLAINDPRALLACDLVPKLLSILHDHLGETCDASQCLTTCTVEKLLRVLLRGPHMHLVVFAPNLMEAMLMMFKRACCKDLINAIMSTAGSAILVHLERLRLHPQNSNREISLFDMWYQLAIELVHRHTTTTYRAWPRFVLEMYESEKRTPVAGIAGHVTRTLKRLGAFSTRYQGSLRSRPAAVECPITCETTHDAVRASDGFCYDRNALLTYFSKGGTTSPMTRETISTIVAAC